MRVQKTRRVVHHSDINEFCSICNHILYGVKVKGSSFWIKLGWCALDLLNNVKYLVKTILSHPVSPRNRPYG